MKAQPFKPVDALALLFDSLNTSENDDGSGFSGAVEGGDECAYDGPLLDTIAWDLKKGTVRKAPELRLSIQTEDGVWWDVTVTAKVVRSSQQEDEKDQRS